jgi:hypothetical protein
MLNRGAALVLKRPERRSRACKVEGKLRSMSTLRHIEDQREVAPRRLSMQLSGDELARLELMFDSCEVRSDPETLSGTDRMMDAMRRTATTKRSPMNTKDSHAGDRALRDSERAGNGPNWNIPRTLEELIQIRRGLMRNEESPF